MKTSKRTKLFAFTPALVVIGITAMTASGVSVVSGATAASTVGLSASVAAAGSSDPDVSAGGCDGDGAASAEVRELLPTGFESSLQMTDGCTLTFWTNNAKGATVLYANALAGAAFLCVDPSYGTVPTDRKCDPNTSLANVPAAGAIANGTDKFGIALTATPTGGGGVVNGTGATATPVLTPTATDAVWYPVTATAQELCKTGTSNTSTTLANCMFKLGGSGEGPTQGAGTYYGRAQLTITQNP